MAEEGLNHAGTWPGGGGQRCGGVMNWTAGKSRDIGILCDLYSSLFTHPSSGSRPPTPIAVRQPQLAATLSAGLWPSQIQSAPLPCPHIARAMNLD